jgi:hypothetical protein
MTKPLLNKKVGLSILLMLLLLFTLLCLAAYLSMLRALSFFEPARDYIMPSWGIILYLSVIRIFLAIGILAYSDLLDIKLKSTVIPLFSIPVLFFLGIVGMAAYIPGIVLEIILLHRIFLDIRYTITYV